MSREARLARETVELLAPRLSPRDAWLEAAAWGSCVSSGDPGACMYGFNEDGVVADEDHRSRCLAWIDRCLATAGPELGHSEADVRRLRALKDYVAGCPTRRRFDAEREAQLASQSVLLLGGATVGTTVRVVVVPGDKPATRRFKERFRGIAKVSKVDADGIWTAGWANEIGEYRFRPDELEVVT